jgi:hypothetical protein
MVFHPDTNGLKAGLAQAGLYLAVLAPVFWAQSYVRSSSQLQRLLWIMLICNGANSFVGIMQVRDPDNWMPKEFTSILTQGAFGLGTVTYKGVGGVSIIRPPGLGDAPGAVCGPGMLAAFLGLIFCLNSTVPWKRACALLLAFTGVTVIYLTLVRTNLLLLGGMVAVYAWLQQVQKNRRQVLLLVALAVGVGAAGLRLAVSFGGQSITSRYSTIIEEKPTDLYYNSRGIQVEHGFFELLPEYPLGAGLGRWGMISYYFGSGKSTGLWAEIQFPAWIIDGGIVLLVCYGMALFKTSRYEFTLARDGPNPTFRNLASTIFAMNAGVISLCFSFPAFLAQSGLQFWFLTGALYGLAESQDSNSEGTPAPKLKFNGPRFHHSGAKKLARSAV